MNTMNANLSVAEKIHALLIAMPDKYNHVKGALTMLLNDELCQKPIGDIKRMFLDTEMAATGSVNFTGKQCCPD